MGYKIRYKRKFFWRTVKNVKGHNLFPDLDRMDIHTDKGIISLPKWSECKLILGPDFLIFQKEHMERESGNTVKINGVN